MHITLRTRHVKFFGSRPGRLKEGPRRADDLDMRISQFGMVVVGCAGALVLPLAASAADVDLEHAAVSAGYHYHWIGVQDAVELTRPGVTVDVRPGYALITINERTITVSRAPRRVANEVYVSPDVVADLRAAAKAAGHRMMARAPETAPAPVGPVSFVAHQVDGSMDVAVDGSADPGQLVSLAEYVDYSASLPRALVTRIAVNSDRTGHFHAVLPGGGSEYGRGVTTITATSGPSAQATASIVLHQPLAGRSYEADARP